MHIQIKKLKISTRKINFWLYLFITVLAVALTIQISLFLYINFYQTITQSGQILILKQSTGVEAINIEKFNKIIEKLNEKTSVKKIENLNNPFD